ncbi:hypothetical protein [Pseudomonas sp. RC10]|uniref:hypothetical protein n=1 Tax=Pseudomonas bambusae TaxID=3139142 RepID=UPI0031398C92
MHRNSELLKAILLFMQDDSNPTQCCRDIETGVEKTAGYTWSEVRLHLALLKDMGLVTDCTTPAEYRLTSAGYDVVESTDPGARLKSWSHINHANTPMTPLFVSSRHPLPPAARSHRLT